MCMIKTVAHERFYKDVAHEPLHPAIPKGPARCHTSPPPDVAPTRTTRRGGASSSSSNFGFLKMFWGSFAMCRCTDQCMDVMEHRMDIIHRNQEILHSQGDKPLIEFLDEPVYPPIPDLYATLTPVELVAFGIGPSRAPIAGSDDDNDGDEEAANNYEETEDNE
jgi:hypothetical protein